MAINEKNENGNGNGDGDKELDTVASYELIHNEPEHPEESIWLETTAEGETALESDELPEELKKEDEDN